MKKALLVVDMQELYIGENHIDYFDYSPNLINSVNQVINKNKENIVVYIRTVVKRNWLNKHIPYYAYEGTEAAELAGCLNKVSDFVFDKSVGDAFSNKALIEFLNKNHIDTVEIIGVDGGGCVSLTAIGAVKNKLNVIINTKAIGTMLEKKREKYFKKLRAMGAEFI
ncbi:MAG: isochorismatase family protein [Acutalibacteraceae bacterium]